MLIFETFRFGNPHLFVLRIILMKYKVINIKNISTGNIVCSEGVDLDAVSAYDVVEQLKIGGLFDMNTTYLVLDKEDHVLSKEDVRTLSELGFTYNDTINVLSEDSNVETQAPSKIY